MDMVCMNLPQDQEFYYTKDIELRKEQFVFLFSLLFFGGFFFYFSNTSANYEELNVGW